MYCFWTKYDQVLKKDFWVSEKICNLSNELKRTFCVPMGTVVTPLGGYEYFYTEIT